jgi:hypothetical protein
MDSAQGLLLDNHTKYCFRKVTIVCLPHRNDGIIFNYYFGGLKLHGFILDIVFFGS